MTIYHNTHTIQDVDKEGGVIYLFSVRLGEAVNFDGR